MPGLTQIMSALQNILLPKKRKQPFAVFFVLYFSFWSASFRKIRKNRIFILKNWFLFPPNRIFKLKHRFYVTCQAIRTVPVLEIYTVSAAR